MTKADMQLLCETDLKLQWWAMLLFAELSEYYDAVLQEAESKITPDEHQLIFSRVKFKVEEFTRLIIHRQLEKAKEGITNVSS